MPSMEELRTRMQRRKHEIRATATRNTDKLERFMEKQGDADSSVVGLMKQAQSARSKSQREVVLFDMCRKLLTMPDNMLKHVTQMLGSGLHTAIGQVVKRKDPAMAKALRARLRAIEDVPEVTLSEPSLEEVQRRAKKRKKGRQKAKKRGQECDLLPPRPLPTNGRQPMKNLSLQVPSGVMRDELGVLSPRPSHGARSPLGPLDLTPTTHR
jgi:hypothetical protein